MKSWQLQRRTFLKGAGASLALPFLNAMELSASTKSNKIPRRLACIVFPNGVSLPGKDHPEHKNWHWFPHGEGKNYKFTKTLESLNPLRDKLSILGGLSHPEGRYRGGHSAKTYILTGAQDSSPTTPNSISLDQLYANHVGVETRVESLQFTGCKASGISFTRTGQILRAQTRIEKSFIQMFGNDSQTAAVAKKTLLRKKSMIDLILEDSKSLNGKLGKEDKYKLDEYLTSVRETEKRVARAKEWLKVPKAKVNIKDLHDAGPSDPKSYMKAFYDIIFFAFQTDTSRVATYLIGGEGAGTGGDKLPSAALGLKSIHHLSHDTRSPEGYKNWGMWDQFLALQFTYFLQKLKNSQEGESNLLDRSLILYGCSTSTTHVARNYPLILAGGQNFGMKHGSYHKFDQEKTRLSDLYVTMLNALGMGNKNFADSTKNLNDVFLK